MLCSGLTALTLRMLGSSLLSFNFHSVLGVRREYSKCVTAHEACCVVQKVIV